MSDDDSRSNGPGWLERLALALTGEPRDREELIDILRDAAERDIIDDQTLRMLSGVFAVGNMRVRDVMVARAQMVAVEQDAQLAELLPVVVESGHSRFPVIGNDRDEVVGLLLAKDLLRHIAQHGMAGFRMADYLRPVARIPESKRLDVLLAEFRESRNHLAIVIDEYGGIAGLVTIEDVLEQIVGDIDDEFDIDDVSTIVKITDQRFSMSAQLPIEDFNDYFDAGFSDEEFDTVGGLVVHQLGHVPRAGEQARIEDFLFRVTRADRRRVIALEVTRGAVTPGKET
ncbi:MAG TPA: transporter associated domain-containing protein [Gammaproteobacteria bacterium]|nr:transporter associated domain-containing protein [Gammaproteobacteria bacterium]